MHIGRDHHVTSETMIYYILVILGVFACSFSQIALKRSATEEHYNTIGFFVNKKVILSYVIFLISVLINAIAVGHGVQVKDLPILESLGYVFVPMLSFMFLSERYSVRLMVSTFLILTGICVFYL